MDGVFLPKEKPCGENAVFYKRKEDWYVCHIVNFEFTGRV